MSATKPNFQYNWNIGDIESRIHKLTNRYPLNERKKIDWDDKITNELM